MPRYHFVVCGPDHTHDDPDGIVHLLRMAAHPGIGGRAGLGIAQGPPKVRPKRQVVGEVAKEVLILVWAINDGFSGGRGIRAAAVTGSSSRGTSRANLPG